MRALAQVSGYAGLLVAAPTALYEVIAYIVPGLTLSERRILAPIVFGSSALFYLGLLFSYEALAPAALKFFISYADGAVESLWSIDQYFEFVLVLMLSTGLAFQARSLVCPVLRVMAVGSRIPSLTTVPSRVTLRLPSRRRGLPLLGQPFRVRKAS